MSTEKAPASEAPASRARGIDARQLRGVPDHVVVPLVPMGGKNTEKVFNNVGLMVGWKVAQDGLISWAPVKLPAFAKPQTIIAAIEVTDMADDDAKNVLASLHWVWMDGAMNFHERYTQPLLVDNCITYRIVLPIELVSADTVFSSLLKVSPMTRSDDGEIIPVLVRGAWLETR